MITKKVVDKTLRSLPDSFTIDELIEQLLFIQKVEQGIKQADENRVVTHQDVRLMIEKWSA